MNLDSSNSEIDNGESASPESHDDRMFAANSEQAFWLPRLFKRSVFGGQQARTLRNMLGITQGLHCLIIGGSPGLHYALRNNAPGKWAGMHQSQEAVTILDELGAQTTLLQRSPLPWEAESFDRVVLIDCVEVADNDSDFIAECHRVLRQSGHLVVQVRRSKRASFLPIILRMLDISGENGGGADDGYSESDLFDLLKDGFDVEEERSYGRFFLMLTDAITGYVAGAIAGSRNSKQPASGGLRRAAIFLALAEPFNWIAWGLDSLCVFSRGYRLVARARRRRWIPRRIPILRDGRSIAEAALGGVIGTAVDP